MIAWPPPLRRAWHHRVARGLRRLAMWGLLPVVVALHAVIVSVVLWPFDPADLVPRGEPLVVLDRHGEVLATLPGQAPNRDAWLPLAATPQAFVDAVLVSEDQRFWDHRGVDGTGLVRATWLNLREGRAGYGGSTLTMQVARLLLGTETQRSVVNKVREAHLALRLERAVDKRTILEHWINRAYYGNGAYGLDAAAQTYFGRPAKALALGEAVLLAVLPRAPSAYDPLRHLAAARARRDRVLAAMVRAGRLTAQAAADAMAMEVAPRLHVADNAAPHFVQWVVDGLPPEVRAGGGTVHTTLDLGLQRLVERRLREDLALVKDANLSHAAALLLDAPSSEIRVMIGSPAWTGPAGQVNMTTRRRHPGSALKPFVYAAGLEHGDHPSTVAYDIVDVSPDYHVAHPAREHGPVRGRIALGSSLNFAAIDALERVGIGEVMTLLRKAGVAALDGTDADYGPRLALGAAKVRLIDLAAGYGAWVRAGKVRPAWGVTEVRARTRVWTAPRPDDHRVVSPQSAWLMADMLADAEARRLGFGLELPVDLPYPVLAKTGTARGFADTWAVMASQEVIAAVWAGNADGSPSEGLVAMDAAAPIARDAMLAFARGRRLTLPPRPDDIVDVEVCAVSGERAGPDCPIAHDHAARAHAPTATCAWHQRTGNSVQLRYPARAQGWQQRTVAGSR